jgi:hypothetical protein
MILPTRLAQTTKCRIGFDVYDWAKHLPKGGEFMKYSTRLLWSILLVAIGTMGLGTLDDFRNQAIAQRSRRNIQKQASRSAMREDLEPSSKPQRAEPYRSPNKPTAIPEEMPPFFNPDEKVPKAMLEDIEPPSRLHIGRAERRKPIPIPEERKP